MDIETVKDMLYTRLKIADNLDNTTERSLLIELLRIAEELQQYREKYPKGEKK